MSEIMQKIITLLIIIIILFNIVSCNHNYDDPVAKLKYRIDKAGMIEYVDSTLGARLLYPDFFKVDTTGEYRARFYYSDENVNEISLSYSIISPRRIDNVANYIHCVVTSDSLFESVREGKYSFILAGGYKSDSPLTGRYKYFRTIHGWGCYDIVYDKKYEDAIEKLIKMQNDWRIYEEDVPKWLTDICCFLDI